MKKFNITGTCIPESHYMVDISDRLSVIKTMIDKGNYFCINRGRQYGKTTTLNALSKYLSNDYTVYQISFEGLDDSIFQTQESLMRALLRLIRLRIVRRLESGVENTVLTVIDNALSLRKLDSIDFMEVVNEMCSCNPKGIILLIDEVDQAGNYESFVKLLGLFRNLYLDRENSATFHSVILAGVYDVKNLKLKVRGAQEHQYNSPWNIAVPFDTDMSLSEKGIFGMLQDYESDHHTGMDVAMIAHLLREYTDGYPFLVSRICLELDTTNSWTKSGFLSAVKKILSEPNTLFDDLQKKLSQFPQMELMFRRILYNGASYLYNYADKEMELATRFGIIKSDCSNVTISNRIFETYLYNYFVTESAKNDPVYRKAADDMPVFVKNDKLDMPLILSHFVQTFTDIYGDKSDTFIEDEGRRYFMLYIKPIINGTGNYYVEAQTRDGGRTDLIIDYLGEQYIIEMKIWRGNSYNELGEKQLVDYLDSYHATTGYLLSFCFNKSKKQGILPPKNISGKTIIEAIV